MRALVPLAAILFLCLIGYLLLRALSAGGGRPAPAEDGGRWETRTEADEGVTTVVVRRVTGAGPKAVETGRQIIQAIPDDDPEWETKYHAAMAEARSRVAALEIESD